MIVLNNSEAEVFALKSRKIIMYSGVTGTGKINFFLSSNESLTNNGVVGEIKLATGHKLLLSVFKLDQQPESVEKIENVSQFLEATCKGHVQLTRMGEVKELMQYTPVGRYPHMVSR